MIGKAVIHPLHGRGIIQKSRRGGSLLDVLYEGQSGSFLSRIDEVEIEDIPLPNAKRLNPQREEQLKSRRLIEAFRYGIVPKDCITNFTFGRDEETLKLKHWLNDPSESGLLLVGGYGSGKTHMLNYIQHIALNEGFAVSSIEIDPLSSPFSKPKRVYGQIVQKLQFKVSDVRMGDFKSLLKKAFGQGLFKKHTYFRYINKKNNPEAAWQWIEAREDAARPDGEEFKNFPGLYGHHGNTANIYCHLLSSIGWATQQREMGTKGLLLLFDEVESLGASRSSTHQHRSSIFLNALLATARNDPDLLDEPSKVSPNFDYCPHASSIPFLYKPASGLKIILAFTDDILFEKYSEFKGLERLYLESLDEQASKEIFDEIANLYMEVYGVDEDYLNIHQIRDYLCEELSFSCDSTRLLVKGFVEALDLMRFHRSVDPFEVLQL